MQILAIVLEILGLMGTVTTAVNQILGIVGTGAQETAKYAIERIAAAAANTVNSPTFGNAALLAAINADKDQGIADTAAILVAIGDAQQTGSPVTLPTTPPTGYGGGDLSTIAGSVWGYTLADGQVAGDQQNNAGNLARNMATGGIALPLGNASAFTLYGTWWSANAPDSVSSAPAWVPANIHADDTLLTFLDRESGYTGWNYDHDHHAYVLQDVTFNDFRYTTLIDELQFQMLKATVAPTVTSKGPPVWPFGGDVTWGESVALSTTFSIDTDMDGVLIDIDSVPAQTSFFNFDGFKSYRFIGALAFFNTEHDIEFPQNLGFVSGMYCPKAMSRADGVILRVKQGVTGTATPWLNN